LVPGFLIGRSWRSWKTWRDVTWNRSCNPVMGGKAKQPHPVHVTWHDAHDLPPKWVTHNELGPEPAVVHSVGYMLTPDPIKDHLTLVTSYTGDALGGGIHIPRSCVLKVRKLS